MRFAPTALVTERRRGKSDPPRLLEQKLADDKRACGGQPGLNWLRSRMMLYLPRDRIARNDHAVDGDLDRSALS